MRHTTLTDELRERAALHALALLDADERQAYGAHLADCPLCAAEVAALSDVTGELGLATPAAPPPTDLRARVLARVAPPAPYVFRLAGEGPWSAVAPGVERRDLGPGSYLVRLAAGSVVARHQHAAVEHCYVLEGDLLVADRHLGPGDYHQAGAGSTHEGLRSDHGCLLLVVDAAA